ncbi:MAG TPA: hypothetical protein VKW04_00560 [Planctomycetota bacterium]|nr:hypothetical protein [Planctomycetota bacterium]
MKQALFVISGAAIGLLASLVAVVSSRTDFMSRVEAQAGPAAGGAGNGTATILGTGGGTNNVNDLCWVLSKVKPAKGPERMVLAMYRAKRGGEFFDLEDVRMIDADLRVFELKGSSHSKETSVEEILKKLPKDEREAIVPRNP